MPTINPIETTAAILADKYDFPTRRDLIQQPIRDFLVSQEQDLACRIDISLVLDLRNCPYREVNRTLYDQSRTGIIGTRKTRVRQSPPTSAFLSAYRDVHRHFFKTLDEMVFKIKANEIPHDQRTLGYSFAEDVSASCDRQVPLHYHCLILSSAPETHAALRDRFFRLKLISSVQKRLTRIFHGSPIKQSFIKSFWFRMPNDRPDDRKQIIGYATKYVNDVYLPQRHNQTFAESQQNYADESRLNQMIVSTDFWSKDSPSEVKRKRNQKRKRSRRQRISARERRINTLRAIDGRKRNNNN